MSQHHSTRIPKEYLEQLLSAVNIEDVVIEYVPELKRTGSKLSACCPFHEEKTPSFTVVPNKGFYHCFGCGANGNAINFLVEYTHANFVDAVKTLSQRVGMQLPTLERADSPERIEERRRFAATTTALREAQKTYAWWLTKAPEGKVPEGMEYIKQRGLTPETIAKFGIGLAPDKRNVITDSKFIDKDGMVMAGLVVVKDDGSRYDRFRNRLMFPITKGKREPEKDYIIGFGGRAIGGQEPKYLNSPEGEFFTKGENLYGVSQALLSKETAKRLFVVEGYMDDVMLSQSGVENVVATMGTAVTEAQIKRLMRLTGHITFCMDGDKPGQKAALKIAEALLPHMNELHTMDLMLLPNDMDPDEYVRAHGVDAFMAEAAKAKGASDFLIDTLKEQEDISTSVGMARYLATVNKWAEQIGYAPIKLAFKNRAAEVAGITLDALMKMAEQVEHAPEPQPQPPAPAQAPFVSVAARLLSIATVRKPALASQIEIGLIEPFLSATDKEMLLPLLGYLGANPSATPESVTATLAYNPHASAIKEAVRAAQLLPEGFDADVEAKAVIDGFRKMRRVLKFLDNPDPVTPVQ